MRDCWKCLHPSDVRAVRVHELRDGLETTKSKPSSASFETDRLKVKLKPPCRFHNVVMVSTPHGGLTHQRLRETADFSAPWFQV